MADTLICKQHTFIHALGRQAQNVHDTTYKIEYNALGRIRHRPICGDQHDEEEHTDTHTYINRHTLSSTYSHVICIH